MGGRLEIHRISALAAFVALPWLPGAAAAQVIDELSVLSPNGEIEFRLAMAQPAGSAALPRPAYEVFFHGKPLIERSFLGLLIQNQPPLGEKLGLVSEERKAVDETYTLPAGKASAIRNHYNSLVAQYLQNGSQGRRLNFEIRAYDDGVAFRYIIPRTSPLEDLLIEDEATEFQFAQDGETYPLLLRHFKTNYEDQFHQMTLSGIHPESLIGLPFLVEQPGVGWVAVAEADVDGYPGMYLRHVDGRMVSSRLSPRADGSRLAVDTTTPAKSPWRVLLIGAEAHGLIESNMVESLNPPSAIEDTAWIRPGKAAWNGWSGAQTDGVALEPGVNTATIEHYVDFAADAGLEYMLIDAGWSARAEGMDAADLTKAVPALDLPAILSRARSKGVGIWLGAHWNSVDRQMNEAFPLFEKWGVAGVKIDFMDRDDQRMADWRRRVAQKAAANHLMIDFHGAPKPDGLRRTYPNVLTQEGVLGLEYSKRSARATPEHNVMLAFTRLLAGPMDYTPGGFDNVTRAEFRPREDKPMVLGTRAHQLALYVVFESPLQMVSDFPEAYANQRDFDFIRAVPASWDETRALGGEVGQHVAIARRGGAEWYLGAITDWTAREIEIPLNFLGRGNYVAEIYADAEDAGLNPKHTRIEEKPVSATDRLTLRLASGGGAAVRFRPAH